MNNFSSAMKRLAVGKLKAINLKVNHERRDINGCWWYCGSKVWAFNELKIRVKRRKKVARKNGYKCTPRTFKVSLVIKMPPLLSWALRWKMILRREQRTDKAYHTHHVIFLVIFFEKVKNNKYEFLMHAWVHNVS